MEKALLCHKRGLDSLSRLRRLRGRVGGVGEGACSRSTSVATVARDDPSPAFQTNGESASCVAVPMIGANLVGVFSRGRFLWRPLPPPRPSPASAASEREFTQPSVKALLAKP